MPPRSKPDVVSQFIDMLADAIAARLGSVGGAAPARGGRGSRAAAPTGRRIRRSAEAVEAIGRNVLNYVKSNPGQGIEQISRGIRQPTKVLKLPVQKLIAARELRTTGQKRATKYFVA